MGTYPATPLIRTDRIVADDRIIFHGDGSRQRNLNCPARRSNVKCHTQLYGSGRIHIIRLILKHSTVNDAAFRTGRRILYIHGTTIVGGLVSVEGRIRQIKLRIMRICISSMYADRSTVTIPVIRPNG